jgi:hypothetical protein
MFVSADQLVLHALGDFIFQSDWMATEKTKKSSAALAHVLVYTSLWLTVTTSWRALAFIAGTHFVIDRWRLARYVVWAKNFMAPKYVPVPKSVPGTSGHMILVRNKSWAKCSATGYDPERPIWLAFWLMIVADNLLHVCCNAVALKWL